MNEIIKSFWSNLVLIIVVFFGIWILGLFIKPIIISFIITLLIIIWKFPKLWAGIKYYWNKLWDKTIKE